jgi:hypothetical protein
MRNGVATVNFLCIRQVGEEVDQLIRVNPWNNGLVDDAREGSAATQWIASAQEAL